MILFCIPNTSIVQSYLIESVVTITSLGNIIRSDSIAVYDLCGYIIEHMFAFVDYVITKTQIIICRNKFFVTN